MRANERSAQIEREDLKAPFAPPGFAVMTGKGRQIDLLTISALSYDLQNGVVLVLG